MGSLTAPLVVLTGDIAADLMARLQSAPGPLSRRLIDTALGAHEAAGLAMAFPSERGARLLEADLALHRLRLELRMAARTGLLADGAARHVYRQVLDAGRMLGGWRRARQRTKERGGGPGPIASSAAVPGTPGPGTPGSPTGTGTSPTTVGTTSASGSPSPQPMRGRRRTSRPTSEGALSRNV